jgi:pimeloyl-ACP methyl ester carboxylesterase
VLFDGGNLGATTSADAIEDWGRTIDDLAQRSHAFAIDKLVKHQSRTEMHVFNESVHFTYREHPEAFNRLVLDYVHGL